MKKFNYSDLTKGKFKISGLRLLTTHSLKTLKGLAFDVLSGILYLAPHKAARAKHNGKLVNVCPSATPGCIAACLYRSGAALIYPDRVLGARIRKTKAFVDNPDAFMSDLVLDVSKIERTGIKRNLAPAIRLNGTSDIRWEKVSAIRDGEPFKNIMEAFPEIHFYDYTKRTDRKRLPANYTLTFSRSGDNDRYCLKMLDSGRNVAVVFYTARATDPLPETWRGFEVIDGDLQDARFNDPQGVVVGLRPKAKARSDKTGFVIRDWR